MKFCIVLFPLLLLHFFAHAQDQFADANSLALANSNISMNTDHGYNENIASLLNSDFTGIAVGHQLNYFVKELSVSSIGLNLKLKDDACISGKLNYSGNSAYNEGSFGIGFGKKLSDKFNTGIEFNYKRSSYSDDLYKDINSISGTIYFLLKAQKKLHFGCKIDNPTRAKISDDQFTPTVIVAGISYLPNDKIQIAITSNQISGRRMFYTIGINYNFLKEMSLKMSYAEFLEQFSSGISMNLKGIGFVVAFRTQRNIGNTSALTILIPFK